MPLSIIAQLRDTGTVTFHRDDSGFPVIESVGDGPALTTLLELSEQVHRNSAKSAYALSPGMNNFLRELREKHGDTLTEEFSYAIDMWHAELFAPVHIKPGENILPGEKLTLYFGEDDTAFYTGEVESLGAFT